MVADWEGEAPAEPPEAVCISVSIVWPIWREALRVTPKTFPRSLPQRALAARREPRPPVVP